MCKLHDWLTEIHQWHLNKRYDQVAQLQPLILNAPQEIWGPDLSDDQSKAIACWLDACLRQYEYYKLIDGELAFQYLQLAYARFQRCVSEPSSELELKSWCIKRMQQLMVLSLEHLNQQHVDEALSRSLIDAHVRFLAYYAWNDDQGIKRGY
ncbi:transcriptional regulator [Vibrio anguillarum]|uniref:Transcriptional regulator n=2 Tax=Vibrio TaxID=662 RepID=A0AAW4AZM1_VIBAN|nr:MULTISPECIES: hypothetical protein [Vibrio]AEH34893.1 Transcriptional repressor [Vibrio anguillarum 775]AGU59457.1 transcriptional regulator [Vibrio anguillarum M3]AQP37581.1 transcriptional regulator [Vibrio anguillarum]ASF93291.1 transcriptional regulator [Vibrio anguillarum]ASG08782.1 transcriptional regulator [Vibrio anguillarum]